MIYQIYIIEDKKAMHKGCIAFLSFCVYRGIFKELSVKMKGVVIKSAFYEKVMEEAVMAKKVLKKKRTAKSGVRTENRASGLIFESKSCAQIRV